MTEQEPAEGDSDIASSEDNGDVPSVDEVGSATLANGDDVISDQVTKSE